MKNNILKIINEKYEKYSTGYSKIKCPKSEHFGMRHSFFGRCPIFFGQKLIQPPSKNGPYANVHLWPKGQGFTAVYILLSFPSLYIYVSFYRAMLCIRGTSHGPVSVRLSVTSRCSTKTAKRRITQTTIHDSPGTLVFWRQRSARNSTGVTPYEGAECRWGGSKSATFDQ